MSLSRRNDAVRDDYEELRKTYDDLLSSHSTAIAKLELAQEETGRLNKQCEEISQERNNAVSFAFILIGLIKSESFVLQYDYVLVLVVLKFHFLFIYNLFFI